MVAPAGKKNIIAGNWKMNLLRGASERLANSLKDSSASLKKSEVWIAPSFTSLSAVSDCAKGSSLRVGAQNVCQKESGAFTGEVSIAMLQEIGVQFALVGHSERRAVYGESIGLCVERAAFAAANGFDVVFCVGETLVEQERGETATVVQAQLKPLLELLNKSGDIDRLIIAYEPVWAIGTGQVASPTQIAEVHQQINQLVTPFCKAGDTLPILYGGSVSADNFAEIIGLDFVSGALVGGASLSIEKFAPLVAISEALG